MPQLARTVAVVTGLAVATLVVQSPSAEAAGGYSKESAPVVSFDDDRPLDDASIQTVRGTMASGGGCTFSIPQLALGPGGESAIEARQIETDFAECTTKIEIGTPRGPKETTATGASDHEVARPAQVDNALTPAGTSSSGYYRVWWEDVINVDVHKVTSNISWTWTGSCVTSSSGSADYWWRSGTGWSKYSSGSWIARACADSRVYTDATYKNGAFCWPGTVWSYYNNVTAQGKANGWLYGWADDTWTTYPFACPVLHFHAELKRVTG